LLGNTRNVWQYTDIESIKHKALRKYAETGSARGVPEAKRLERMLAFIAAAESLDELAVPSNFGFHKLTGDRKGSLAMTVTKSWRLTFKLNDEKAIVDMDLEDYH